MPVSDERPAQTSCRAPATDAAISDGEADSPASLEAFFADVQKRAYRMAYLATGDREEALDLLQDSMLRMVKKYRSSPADSWRLLFYRILSNRLNDWHRRRHIRAVLGLGVSPDDGYEEYPADERQQPLRLAESGEAIAHIDRALRELSQRQRQVFLLRCWEGLSVNDTAQVVGCSANGVKVHLFRALRALRGRLENHYGE